MPEPSRAVRLSPHAWAALAAAALAALGTLERPEALSGPLTVPSSVTLAIAVSCSGAAIPEGTTCVPLPGAPTSTAAARALATEEGIPRRPDRPAAFGAYVFPFGRDGHPHRVGAADVEAGAVPSASRAGPFALVLWDAPASRVTLLRLAGQEGDADVVWVGDLRGTTVVTRHVVREPRGVVSILVFVGNLSKPLVAAGDPIADGEPIGRAGAVGPSGVVVLETRRVREGSPLDRALPHAAVEELVSASQSIPCDPRNVLALRAP